MRHILLYFFIIAWTTSIQGQSIPLFRLLNPSETNINFNNPIEDTKEANILIYEAFYDGGGVAIGDINNDGFSDIYFAGNQVEDQLYLNKGNMKFEDITATAGILQRAAWSTGVTMVDINNDGWLDIYVCKSLYDDYPELRVNELYINNGYSEEDGKKVTFTESAQTYGLNDPWRSMQATFFDFDKDGDSDLFLVNQPPNPGMFSPLAGQDWMDTLFSCRLLENKGDSFEDISSKAGVRKRGYGLSATTGDYNKDGWPDIYVCNDYDSPDFLYLNQGDGTFQNVINQAMKHISYFSMGSDAADINNDGWLDIVALDMVAEDNYRLKANMGGMEPEKFWSIVNVGGHHQYMFNTLQLNRGTAENGELYFSDIAQLAGISNTDWSWAPLLADFDNDGFKDLFITNGIKKDLRNTDAIKKTEDYFRQTLNTYMQNNPSQKDINLWDIVDLNYILDLIPSEKLSNYMFRNKNGYEFEKVMKDWGMNQKTFSSGAAYGDLDNDGDLDLVVNNVDEVAYIYENTLNDTKHKSNHYLRIQLLNPALKHTKYGSRVEIHYGENKQQVYEFTNARGFYSSSEQIAHFGLGKYKKVDEVIVYWLDGHISKLKNVKTNQLLSINYQKSEAKPSPPLTQPKPIFSNITKPLNLNYIHKENEFNDFEREVLLPHSMSNLGPALATGDINGDGLDDIFVGGAHMHNARMWVQQIDQTFIPTSADVWQKDKAFEDIGAVFFDADVDGDLDLYVVSGGNEHEANLTLYQDRLYLNNGKGQFKRSFQALPIMSISGSVVVASDFDKDGYQDLFVGGRQVPGKWPSPTDSYLLKNITAEKGQAAFKNVTAQYAPALQKLGMVTDAVWSDYDKDGWQDLIVVGEWMPITVFQNQKGKLDKIIPLVSSHSPSTNDQLTNLSSSGWWYSIEAYDLDQDGDDDYVLGNLGLNYKYKASQNEPFSVHYDDFDDNGKQDIVLSYYNFGEQYPLRGRSCSSQQIPQLKEKFPTYHTFASSSLADVYGLNVLQEALQYEAYNFASACIQNNNGSFVFHPLPLQAQFSSINDILAQDFDKDGYIDLLVAGNLYGSEVETPRNDAGMGLLLKGNGGFNFSAVPMNESGLCLPFEIKHLEIISLGKENAVIAAPNQGQLQAIGLKNDFR